MKLYEWLALPTHIELILLKRKWKRKETNNLSKVGSQYGVFSSLFFISGIGVIVALLAFQLGRGGAEPFYRSIRKYSWSTFVAVSHSTVSSFKSDLKNRTKK